MIIHSVWRFTLGGRSLRVDYPAAKATDKDIIVFTKKPSDVLKIQENMRIASTEIAKTIKIRKFLELSEKTAVKAGTFEITAKATSADKLKNNIAINDSLYFLCFIPDVILPFNSETTLLIPANEQYYARNDLKTVKEFVKASKPKNIIISGRYGKEWLNSLNCGLKIELKNEMIQKKMFD